MKKSFEIDESDVSILRQALYLFSCDCSKVYHRFRSSPESTEFLFFDVVACRENLDKASDLDLLLARLFDDDNPLNITDK